MRPDRTGREVTSWADLLADTIAVILGLVVGTLLLDLIRRCFPSDRTRA